MDQSVILTCECGQTALQADGRHIVSVECCCNSCRQAGAYLQSLPAAPPLLEANGVTRFVVHRKDRIRCVRGAETMREHRLSPAATTRRVVATCCNTPMFLEFMSGHWLSLYGRRYPPAALPRLEMRTMASDLPAAGAELPNDVPNARTQSAKFFAKLLVAWAAMGFRVPPINFVNGAIDGRAE